MNLTKEKKSERNTTNSALASYLKDINKYKVLTHKEEAELIWRMRNGDEEAKDILIAANQRFVYAVAKKYGNEDNVLDLVNEGNIGLMEALRTFDDSKGTRFLSYAIWYIKRGIYAYLNGENLLIRKTNNTKTVFKVNKIKNAFFAEHNRYPSIDEVCDILENDYGLKIKDKSDLLDVITTSISTCYDDEDERAFENTPYFTSRTSVSNEYVDEMEAEHNALYSETLLNYLPEREREIIAKAFGIGYARPLTNAEIAEDLGLSTERVRQLRNAAIEKMRKVATAEHLSF